MKFTTTELREKVINDKDISEEDKKEELEKTIISNDAYAVIDYIEKLTKKLEHLRVSALMK